jgi:hypothetical protein
MLTVTIRRVVVTADTPVALRQAVRSFIDRHGYGSSEIGAQWRVYGHPRVTHISYNGRLWSGQDEYMTVTPCAS